MIKKKNIKKDPQRLKHKVRFDIELFQDPKNNEVKLFIVFIQKGGIADGKLLLGDKIKSINGIAVNNKEIEFDNEINKINWGDEATFEVERKNKVQKVKIKTLTFYLISQLGMLPGTIIIILIGSELNDFLIKGSPFSIDLVLYLTLLGLIPLLFKKYNRF